jgi:hypothetical protein
MFASLRIPIEVVERSDCDPARVSSIQERLTESLGESLVKGTRRGEFEQRCYAALLRRIYHNLTAAASHLDPKAVAAHIKSIDHFAGVYVSERDRVKLFVDLLCAALPAAGEDWREYEPLLELGLFAEEPGQAAKLLEVFEATDDVELKTQLARMLTPYLDAEFEESIALEEVPERVRKALGDSGAAEAITRDDCLKTFRDEAQAALRAAEAPGVDKTTLLEQTAQLARLATQGMALSHNDLATFEEARSDPMIDEQRPSPEAGSSSPIIPANANAHVQVLVDRISRTNKLDQRLSALEMLAGMAPTISDIHPDVAEKLASYYISSRNENEHRQRMLHLSAMKDWNNLRIAIAHEIGTKTGYDFQLEEIVNEYIGERFEAPTDAHWTKRARARLLRDALQYFSEAADEAPDAAAVTLTGLEATVKQQLFMQANLVGVDAKDLKMDATPAEILRAITFAQATALKEKVSEPAQVKSLGEIPYRVAAIDYLTSDDFERTVRLDRVWLELLGIQLDNELRSRDASQQVSDLLQRDLEASGLLEQLRNSQAALVRMWLIRLERTS